MIYIYICIFSYLYYYITIDVIKTLINVVGMLRRSDGRVYKPVVKPLLGKREISFYENLQISQDPVMLQLKNYVPRYYGTTELQIFGRRKISKVSNF